MTSSPKEKVMIFEAHEKNIPQQLQSVLDILDLETFDKLVVDKSWSKEEYCNALGSWVSAKGKEYNESLLLSKKSLSS